MNQQRIYALLAALACTGLLWAEKEPVVITVTPKEAPVVAPVKVEVDSIGIIKLHGNISFAPVEKIARKAAEFAENEKIKGVLLVINSGGGSAGASDALFREIKELAAVKPVVALVPEHCASGAYHAATAAHWIVASAWAAVGSIGVVSTIEKHKNVRRASQGGYSGDADIELIHAGKDKVVRSTHSAPLNPEQRAKIQAEADALYKLFYTSVAKQRNLSLNNLHTWAEGQVLLGEEARDKRLIDQVGGLTDARRKLEELVAKQAGKPVGKLPFVE